ncbi:RIP metalloprotease RseP [Rugamonas sp. CCM 8940]|uniref:RIP metalloprotease RseP n=1 Tax=Rugamonas sp. CCM 8940 TaxID=2765359 RepID=UPI0018F6DFBA|nr:RIP metalloprotease RseP [Rugamonas sp. CCM 8940]MBJ7310604.1 RIP metalloprotease RseP [Rugamonas sp. CCM 8940]
MSFLHTLLAFVVALGSLIVIHELGHYWVARLFGVKVLRFSIGMGKVVWSRRFGPDQTEWAVSALPLGGYVKMLDGREQDLSGLAPAELKREFTRQSVWVRIAIVAAGPLANFIVAILLFSGLYMVGVAEPSSKVGASAAGSPAAIAGLHGGDRVSAVNGQAVAVWSELRWQLIQAAIDKAEARLDVERPGAGHYSLLLPAAALATLDLEGDVLGKLGINVGRPPPVIEEVVGDGAGARAGLRKGDLIVAVDGRPVADGPAFIGMVRGSPGRTLNLALRRAGQDLQLPLTPDAQAEQAGKGATAVTVGKINVYVAQMPDMITVPSSAPAALQKAVAKVWDTSAMTLKMIGKMIVGEVSWKNVTGPITIADYAGQTARIGAASYLSFIAFISISLGVMNLLPIPVLDGGHLLYYSLEVLTGRPVPERVGEIAQRLGVGLLVTLMVLAVFNDFARLL